MVEKIGSRVLMQGCGRSTPRVVHPRFARTDEYMTSGEYREFQNNGLRKFSGIGGELGDGKRGYSISGEEYEFDICTDGWHEKTRADEKWLYDKLIWEVKAVLGISVMSDEEIAIILT